MHPATLHHIFALADGCTCPTCKEPAMQTATKTIVTAGQYSLMKSAETGNATMPPKHDYRWTRIADGAIRDGLLLEENGRLILTSRGIELLANPELWVVENRSGGWSGTYRLHTDRPWGAWNPSTHETLKTKSGAVRTFATRQAAEKAIT